MFNIVVDSREKIPWDLSRFKEINHVEIGKLNTGDYTIAGLEKELCIERKKSVSEFARSIIEDRFEDQLQRMRAIPNSFLLLEFGMNDVVIYPQGSNVPRRLWRKLKIRGPFILRALINIQIKYGVQVVFCGDRENAEDYAVRIMKYIYEYW